MPIQSVYSQRLEGYLAKGVTFDEAHKKASNDAAVAAVKKKMDKPKKESKKPSNLELAIFGKHWYKYRGKKRKEK